MKVKISQLPDATSFTPEDLFLIVDKETLITQKVTLQQIIDKTVENIDLSSLTGSIITGSSLGTGSAAINLFPNGTIQITGNTYFSGTFHQITGTTNINGLLQVSQNIVSLGDLSVSGNTIVAQISGTTATYSIITASAGNFQNLIIGNISINNNIVAGINQLTASNISSSNIVGNFFGNGSAITNIITSNISNFTNDVRNQISAGTGITINNGQISASNSITNVAAGTNLIGGGNNGNISVSLTSSITGGLNNLTGLSNLSSAIVTASVLSASSYVGLPNFVGGQNGQVQFNSGSQISGSESLTYDYAAGILSGTLFRGSITQFTIISGSVVTGALGLFTAITAANISGTNANFAQVNSKFIGDGNELTNITTSSLVHKTITIGTSPISLNETISSIQGLNNLTASTAFFQGDVRINGTASIAHLNTIEQTSLVVGDKYIVVMSGGVDHTGLDGSGMLWGSGSSGPTVDEQGANAHILYRNSYDKLEIYPGLYVSGAITASAEISGTNANFAQVNSKFVGDGNSLTNITTSSLVHKSLTIGATQIGLNETASNIQGLNELSASAISASQYIGNFNGTVSGDGSSLTNLVIGTAEDNDYTDGLFTDFTSGTLIGTAVDRFNTILKGLAPSPAPSLSNLEKTNGTAGITMKLSFGQSSSTASYTNVTASLNGGLTVVDVGGTFTTTNGSGGGTIRLGVYTGSFNIPVILNNSTTANSAAYVNYPDDAFNVPKNGIASYKLEVNGTEITPTGSTTDTSSYSANNFSLSLANTGSFITSGQSFDLFRYRTGTVTIPSSSWRNGHNYAKVTQISSLGTQTTNYIDWIYDPNAASGMFTYAFNNVISASFNPTGEKYLSGIRYYTNVTYNFSCSIGNYYKNVYSSAANGGITFGSLTPGLSATAFTSTPAPTNSDSYLERSSAHSISGIRILGTTLQSTMTVNNGLGKTGNTTLTTNKILCDQINTANTDSGENFCLENYRVSSASYSTQSELSTASAFPSASALATSELLVYNGGVRYPTTAYNNGNISGSDIVHILSGQPNYSGSAQDRYYFRKFVNGGNSVGSFDLILTGSNIDFAAYDGSLVGNSIKIAIKIPGKTGWRDTLTAAPSNTTGIELNDNVGCLQGSAPSNIVASAGRTIQVNLLTEALAANEVFVVRILASKDWTGAITKLQINGI